MKIGTILENPWASKDNPSRLSIYQGTTGTYFQTIFFRKNKLEVCKYYKRDLKEFKVVGESKTLAMVEQELKEID